MTLAYSRFCSAQSFVFDSAEHAAGLFNLQTFGHIYGRLSNPTTSVLEERIATLEGGRGATCTSSGHAAQVLTLFPLMGPGTRVVASNKLYGGSITQFAKTIKKFGWECTFVVSYDPSIVPLAPSSFLSPHPSTWREHLFLCVFRCACLPLAVP